MHTHHPIHWLNGRVTGRVGRWVALAIWLMAAGLLSGLAPKLANLYDNNASSAIGNQESVQAQQIIQQHFPGQRGLPAVIVFTDKSGLTDADYAKAQQVSDWLTTGAHPKQLGHVVSIYTVPQARSQLVSSDGKAMTMVVPLTINPSDPAFSDVMTSLRAYTDQFEGHGTLLQVKVTGPAGVIADAVFIFKSTDLPLLLTTIALVLVLLINSYRSPIGADLEYRRRLGAFHCQRAAGFRGAGGLALNQPAGDFYHDGAPLWRGHGLHHLHRLALP